MRLWEELRLPQVDLYRAQFVLMLRSFKPNNAGLSDITLFLGNLLTPPPNVNLAMTEGLCLFIPDPTLRNGSGS